MAFGEYHYDPIDGEYSFVGAFASKNQLGFFSSLGIYFAFACVFILRERGFWCLFGLLNAGLCLYALIASQSATSIIAVAATLAVMVVLGVMFLFAQRTRKALLLAALLLGLGLAVVGLNLGGLDVLLGAFGKDATLTGRTYLWAEGFAAAGQAPVLGVGYQAYWVQGFSEAERLWEEFYIGSRSGFHFHNTYIEVLVELGFAGFDLLCLLIIRVTAGHLIRVLDDHADRAAHVMFGIALMLLVRSFFEVDVITPYVVGSFMLYYAAGSPCDVAVKASRFHIPPAQPNAGL